MYSTEFNGSFKFSEKVSLEIKELVNGISETRRVTRDVEKLEEHYGDDFYLGQFFVPGVDSATVAETYVIDENMPPGDQPGLWMDWKITDDGRYLVWNGAEGAGEITPTLDWSQENWVSVQFYKDGDKRMVYLEGMTNEERFWACIEKINELANKHQ